MLDKMKALMDMQRKMQQVKSELDSALVEAESGDRLVKVVISGAQEIKEVLIQKELQDMDKTQLEKAIKDAYNKALKRSQEMAAAKMKNIVGFNIPGLT
jgi:nucleoid-associated protein EbfC